MFTIGKLVLIVIVSIVYGRPPLVYPAVKPAVRISAVRYDSSGKKLAVGKDDGSISVYDTESKQTLWTTAATNIQVYTLYFREFDTQLVAIEFRGSIRVFAVNSGRLLKDFKPNLLRAYGDRVEKIVATAIDSSGTVLALAGDLFSVIAFVNLDIAINKVNEDELFLSKLLYFVQPPLDIAIAVSFKKPSIAYMGELTFQNEGRDTITALHFNPSTAYLTATTRLGYLIIWKFESTDFTNGRLVRVSPVDPSIRKVGSSRDEFRALTGVANSEKRVLTIGHYSKYGAMQLWDLEKGEMIHYEENEKVDPGGGTRVIFNHSGQMAMSTGDTGYRLWAVKDDKLKRLCRVYYENLANRRAYPNAVDFSPTQTVVALGYLSTVYVLDIPSLQIVARFGNDDGKLTIDPDPKL